MSSWLDLAVCIYSCALERSSLTAAGIVSQTPFYAKSCFIMPEDSVKCAIKSCHEPTIASQNPRWSKKVTSSAAQTVRDSLTCNTFDILAHESTGETACAIHREAGASRSLCSPPAGEGPEFRVSQGVCTHRHAPHCCSHAPRPAQPDKFLLLQALNNYVDSTAKHQVQQSVLISFWVREDDSFVKIEAELPSHGSLGPLFYAFGLISDEELRQGYGSYDAGGRVKFRLQSATVRSQLRASVCLP